MFLHSGAGLHKHEYSPPAPPTVPTIQRASSWLRSPWASPVASFPNNNDVASPSEPAVATPVSSPRPSLGVGRPSSESTLDTMSEEEPQMGSDAENLERVRPRVKRRRSLKPRTTYHLAHPAPTHLTQKKLLHIRPKLLVQLQRLSSDSRPEPTLDVVPVHHFHLTRMAKKLPLQKYVRKLDIGSNDVMVMTSEHYKSHKEEHSDDLEEDRSDGQEVIAAICQMKKDEGYTQGKVEIFLNDGNVWEATPKANGNYEFVLEGEGGQRLLTARWVRRALHKEEKDKQSDPSIPNYKHTFSIVDPSSRRHPIMATLKYGTLDIFNSFTMVKVLPKVGESSPLTPTRSLDSELEDFMPSRTTHMIDGNLRTLIQVTALWVAAREGVCPYYKYNDTSCNLPLPLSNKSSPASPEPSRSQPESPIGGPDGSAVPAGGKFTNLLHRNSPVSPTSPQFERRQPPRRSTSISTAVLHSIHRRGGGLSDDGNGTEGSDTPSGSGGSFPTRAATTSGKRSVSSSAYDPRRFSMPARGTSSLNVTSTPDRARPVSYGPYTPGGLDYSVATPMQTQTPRHDLLENVAESPQSATAVAASAAPASSNSRQSPAGTPGTGSTSVTAKNSAEGLAKAARKQGRWRAFRRCFTARGSSS